MTQADTNKLPGRPDTETPTPVPRTKVHAQHYCRMPECIPLCLCINSSQRTCYGNVLHRDNVVLLLFLRDFVQVKLA